MTFLYAVAGTALPAHAASISGRDMRHANRSSPEHSWLGVGAHEARARDVHWDGRVQVALLVLLAAPSDHLQCEMRIFEMDMCACWWRCVPADGSICLYTGLHA